MTEVHASIVADSFELHDDCQDETLNLRILQTYVEGFQMAWRMCHGVDKETQVNFTLQPHPGQPDLLAVYVEINSGPLSDIRGLDTIDHPLCPFSERPEASDSLDITGAVGKRSAAGRGVSAGDEAPMNQRPSGGGEPSPEGPLAVPPDRHIHRPRF